MSLPRESGDLDGVSVSLADTRHTRESEEPQSVVVAVEESDEAIVPKKPAKTWVTPVESVEGRARGQGENPAARNALPTQGGTGALHGLSGLDREPKQAKR